MRWVAMILILTACGPSQPAPEVEPGRGTGPDQTPTLESERLEAPAVPAAPRPPGPAAWSSPPRLALALTVRSWRPTHLDAARLVTAVFHDAGFEVVGDGADILVELAYTEQRDRARWSAGTGTEISLDGNAVDLHTGQAHPIHIAGAPRSGGIAVNRGPRAADLYLYESAVKVFREGLSGLGAQVRAIVPP